MLITPGSSLGGARPKAGIVDAKEDLKELWNRIVFNVCVSNTVFQKGLGKGQHIQKYCSFEF